MDIKSVNFELLYKQHYMQCNVQHAIQYLSQFDANLSSAELAHVLRNHYPKPITSILEIGMRDSVDYLLDFYSILEVASIAGYIPAKLDKKFVVMARLHLNQPDVKRYYHKHYKLLLPELFLRRINSRRQIPLSENSLTENTSALDFTSVPSTVFMRFHELISRKQSDRDIDMLLWFLDDGIEGGYDWSDMVRPLTNVKLYAAHITQVPDKQTPLDQALRGLSKFLAFCEEFNGLLVRIDHFPLLQSAMWHYYRYWFDHLKDHLGSVINEAINRMGKWKVAAPHRKEFSQQFNSITDPVRAAVSNLASNRYNNSLVKAARRYKTHFAA